MLKVIESAFSFEIDSPLTVFIVTNILMHSELQPIMLNMQVASIMRMTLVQQDMELNSSFHLLSMLNVIVKVFTTIEILDPPYG